MKRQDNTKVSLRETNWEAILDAMGDAVTVQDKSYRIIYQNRVLVEQFGECIGQFCYSAYENRAAVCPDCLMAKCYLDGKVHKAERHALVGEKTSLLDYTVSPVRGENGRIVAAVAVVRDVTSRKQTADQLTHFMNMYAALSHTNKAIMESLSREEMFARICKAAVEFGKFSLAVIGLTGTDGIIRSITHFGSASRYLDTLVVSADARREEGRGPTGRAIREGVPYVCNDYQHDPRTTPWRIAARKHGIRASAAFPLKLQGIVVGALKVYSDHAGFFHDEIVELLTEMAANISFGLENFLRDEQRVQSEAALRKSEERLKLVLEGSNDGYFDWHLPSSTVWLSNRYLEMLGYVRGEIEQTPAAIEQLIHSEDRHRFDGIIGEGAIRNYYSFEIDVRMKTKNGEWKWILHRGKVVEKDGQGGTVRVAGTCTDITEKRTYEEQLKYASVHDQLTGLYNRAYFDSEFARLKVGRCFPVSFVIADIDGLKLVNDSFGHAEGDRLIQLAATVMKASFRAEDVVARIGGDEFAVILPNAAADVVTDAVKRIRAFKARQSQNDYCLSISLGSATADTAEQLNEALKLADSRMYYNKFKKRSERSYTCTDDRHAP